MAIQTDVAGDMVKSTYDPDKDGIIALAQLVAAVCSESEAKTTSARSSLSSSPPTVLGVGFAQVLAA
ncbi:unnamed protein product [marine sediment metagenome]|uniref:EF-hand domain-containing protein n=1 Tax=marine sediment metagenome TaxID=412755 RepID=X1TM45_9ZZZZ